MAQGVVDGLEVVQVKEVEGQGLALAPGGLHAGFGVAAEEAPAGEAREGIGVGQAPQLRLQLLAAVQVALQGCVRFAQALRALGHHGFQVGVVGLQLCLGSLQAAHQAAQRRVHSADVVVAQRQGRGRRCVAVDVVGGGDQLTQGPAHGAPKQELLQQQAAHEEQAGQAHQPAHLLQGVGQHALGVGGHHHPAGGGLAFESNGLQHPAIGHGAAALAQLSRPSRRAAEAGEQALPFGIEHHRA